jgi:hypothetical protein
MRRKMPELWPSDWILQHDNSPNHKALSVKQFLAQKSMTGMEHPSCSPDLVPNDSWVFPNMKSVLKRQRFQDSEYIQNKMRRHTENCFTTGIPKMFPTLAVSLD